MAAKTKAATAKYIYAVTRSGGKRPPQVSGIDGRPVSAIGKNGLWAVVGDLESQKIRPHRKNLAAHQAVLQAWMEIATPLPVSFGMVAAGAKAVEDLLSRYRDDLEEALDRIDGKMEMTLRVVLDVPNVFAHYVTIHPELAEARDRLFAGRDDPPMDAKIELGRLFDRLLQQDREDSTDLVEQALTPHCAEIKRNPCRDERIVMDLACLIDRDGEKQFETGLFEAARHFDNSYTFDYSGPWVPHNFVDLRVEL